MSTPGLFTRHRDLARLVAGEFYLPGADRDDVEQEALIGLWIAARQYDGTTSFRSWASFVIRRRLITLLREALALKHQPLTRAARVGENEDGEQVQIVDLLPDAPTLEHVVVARDTLARVVAAVQTLTPAEREGLAVIVAGAPYSRRQTGSKQLENAVDRARAKLRRAAA